jgi:hypothetical protein
MTPDDDVPPEVVEVAIAAGAEALHPHSREVEADVRRQMQTMFHRDRLMAIVFVIAMLVVLPFVLVAVWGNVPSDGIRIVLVVSCAIVLVYNVASMVALVRNYQRDRDFIYRRDVAHLRERAALRAARNTR